MAKNRVYSEGNQFSMTVPSGVVSGDPVAVGQIPGVALTDRSAGGNATGKATVQTDGVFNLSVKGINNVTNGAIAEGDIVYFDVARTPKLDVTVTGKRFGYALDPVTSGATTTIRVKIGY